MRIRGCGASKQDHGRHLVLVTKIEGDTAAIDYKTLATLINGKREKSQEPELVSKVQPDGMATDLTASRPTNILFLVLNAAGITPNANLDTKAAVPIHWQNTAKNFTLDGSGTVTATDKTAKTITVEWAMKLTTPSAPEGQFKLTSVYSTDDYSLKTSKGALSMGNDSMAINISRAEAQSNKAK